MFKFGKNADGRFYLGKDTAKKTKKRTTVSDFKNARNMYKFFGGALIGSFALMFALALIPAFTREVLFIRDLYENLVIVSILTAATTLFFTVKYRNRYLKLYSKYSKK